MLNFIYMISVSVFIYAQELPESIMKQVDAALATSYVELMTCEVSPRIGKEKEEKYAVITRKKVMTGAMSSGLGMSGIASIVWGGIIYGSNIYEQQNPLVISKSLNVKMTRFKANLSSMAAGVASIGSGFYLGARNIDETAESLNQLKVEQIASALNQDDLEKVASRISEDVALLFSLSMDKKATLKSSIKRAIYNGANVTLGEVISESNFRNQKILTEQQRKVLQKISEEVARLENSEIKQQSLSDEEKINTLRAAQSELLSADQCADRVDNIKKQIKSVDAVLAQVDSALILQKSVSSGDNKMSQDLKNSDKATAGE